VAEGGLVAVILGFGLSALVFSACCAGLGE
jgi:hypothetical protein